MKHFLKVFSIAFLCFVLAASAGVFTYVKFYDAEADGQNPVDTAAGKEDNDNKPDEEEIKDPLEKAISKSKRVNFLLLGMEGPRTDTIMFASFDTKSKKVDMISIPRDTYYYRKGHESADARKINAVYGNDGIEGIKNAVEKVLGGVPIDHYVKVDYKGVEKIVDALGGVEVNVPFHMQYSDPTDKPPLYIDIPKGKQVLNGKKAVQFLRFRHNNDMTVGYPDGDLGRIKAQQQFVSSAIKKSLSLKLPNVIKACFTYVKTDVGLSDALVFSANALGIDMEDISMTTLPGEGEYRTIKGTRLSYFKHDPDKIKEMMMKIYEVEENTKN